jgi:hypothetical protein
MFRDAKAKAALARQRLPCADDVSLRPHCHGIPSVMLRVPKIEVVVVDTHADEVPGARGGVLVHQSFGIEPFRRPQRNDVLVAK